MKSNSENKFNENKDLQKENEELKARLSINKKIIQEFFKNSSINEKISVFVENIKKENNLLFSKVETLKKENEKLLKICQKTAPDQKNKNIDLYENKLFVYENLLKEKQSIIVSLKEQNKNFKELFESKLHKDKVIIKEKETEENILNDNNNGNDDGIDIKGISNNNMNKDGCNKYIIEEIYITSPCKVVNTLNDKLELYKSVNNKLKNLIHELKSNLLNKEKDFIKLEEEGLKMKQELQRFTQMKNNEEIISQLIQYQSMKSLPISQSCANLKIQNNEFNNKNNNTRNKTKKNKSSEYIMNYSNNFKNEKIMKEIEIYENVNKTVKEITDNDFDLAGEWAETLKHCGMTQEEFLRFCGMKVTSKLTNAIEYLYKILIDKNIQIKLLSLENEALNEENIRLNKINIEMESIINYNHLNNNHINQINKVSPIIKNDHKEIYKKEKNKKIKRNNSFFDNYKNKFLNESKSKFNNSSSKNELQSTFVNVDNNITHTNININMMMDYEHINDINKNSVTSSEFRDGLLLNDLNNINNNNISKTINKSQNMKNFNLIEPKKYKSKDKVLRYLKLNKRKINNNSCNKLIIDKKNDMNEKTQNISTIKKSCKNFDKLNAYNKTIKNIFSNTDKIQIKNIKKNVNQNFKTNENKGINLNTDIILKNLKLIQKKKFKRKVNNRNNKYNNILSKSENKVFNQYKLRNNE